MSLSSTDTSGVDDGEYEDIENTNFEEDDDDINDEGIITPLPNAYNTDNMNTSSEGEENEYHDALDTSIINEDSEQDENEEEEEEEEVGEQGEVNIQIRNFRSLIMNLINQRYTRTQGGSYLDDDDDDDEDEYYVYNNNDDDDDEFEENEGEEDDEDDGYHVPMVVNQRRANTNNVNLPQPIEGQTINSQLQIRLIDQNTKIDRFLLNRELSDKKRDSIIISQHYLPMDRYKNVKQLEARIFCCKITADGRRLMTASQDKKIRIYNTSNYEEIKSIDALDISWSIIDTDYSPDQNWLVYSSWSQYIQLCRVDFNTTDDEDFVQQDQHRQQSSIRGGYKQAAEDYHESLFLDPDTDRFCVFGIKFSPNNKEILCGCSDGQVMLYDLERRTRSNRFRGHVRDVNSVCYLDHTGNVFVTGSDDSLIRVWDKRSLSDNGNAQPIGTFTGHSQGITHVTSKDDGTYLLSNSKDQSAKLWDIRKMTSKNCKPPNGVNSNWEYRYNAYPGDWMNARNVPPSDPTGITDLSLMTYRGHQVIQTLIRCYFSPLETTSQKYIYSGSFNGIIYIYDILTGRLVQTLNQKNGPIRDLSWSPNSMNLISTNWNGKVTSWSDFHDIRA